jgi:flavodoxin
MTGPARVAVVYYSATGNVHRLAHALAERAGGEGAEVIAEALRDAPAQPPGAVRHCVANDDLARAIDQFLSD